MKLKKLKVDELLRLACCYAEQNQEDYLCAIENTRDEESIEETKAFINQIREYRLKRWGKTKLEATLDEMESVPVSEILNRTAQR